MTSLQMFADRASAGGKLALVFTVYLVVDPRVVTDSTERPGDELAAAVVRDEIASNLESVPYVQIVKVWRRRI